MAVHDPRLTKSLPSTFPNREHAAILSTSSVLCTCIPCTSVVLALIMKAMNKANR